MQNADKSAKGAGELIVVAIGEAENAADQHMRKSRNEIEEQEQDHEDEGERNLSERCIQDRSKVLELDVDKIRGKKEGDDWDGIFG